MSVDVTFDSCPTTTESERCFSEINGVTQGKQVKRESQSVVRKVWLSRMTSLDECTRTNKKSGD